MKIIKIGKESCSESAFQLMSIIDEKGCADNMIYEIHSIVTSKDVSDPEFIKRSSYSAFVNPELVDKMACNNISYAALINEDLYMAIDTGSNTYLGEGPTTTLKIREQCFVKKIKLEFVNKSIEEWIKEINKL